MSKLALITGGSTGLGAALLRRQREQGWQVREYSRSGTGADHIDCDFADPVASTQVLARSFAELAAQSWSELRLINNAGTLQPIGPIAQTDPEAALGHLHVNLGASIAATGLFLRHFAHQNAPRSVINISSGAASNPYHGWSLYCASKAGLEAFTRCVALEHANTTPPTRIIAIRPGIIETNMQATIRAQDTTQFQQVEKFRELHAAGQLQSADQAALKVLALAERGLESGAVVDVRDV